MKPGEPSGELRETGGKRAVIGEAHAPHDYGLELWSRRYRIIVVSKLIPDCNNEIVMRTEVRVIVMRV
jgi:hypothetical protein